MTLLSRTSARARGELLPNRFEPGRKAAASRSRVNWVVVVAAVWLGLCVFAAVFADFIQLYDHRAIDLRARLVPPVGFGGTWLHPLGTDELGRDIYSRLIASIRMSLLLALIGTLGGAILGTTLGFLAAHFRGLVDDAVMVFIDIQASLPFFVVALVAVAIVGPSLWLFIILLSVFGWERYARLVRALAISATEHGYAEALRGLGVGPLRVYARHIFPNIAGAIIVNASLNFSETLLLESTLSFLGLGVQPPATSLGNMVGFARDYLVSAWWMAVFPAAVILFCTLSIGILGDWLRDRLDPNTR